MATNPDCPVCFSEAVESLGRLGRREHFRCRQCGSEFSAPIRHDIQEGEVPTGDDEPQGLGYMQGRGAS